MDWIYDQASLYISDLSSVRGENFQQIDGQKLCEMKEEDFIGRDAANGLTLYRCLQDYRTLRKFIPVASGYYTIARDAGILCGDFVDFCFFR